MSYIDEHKHLFGVEPICQALTSFVWPIRVQHLPRRLPAAARLEAARQTSRAW